MPEIFHWSDPHLGHANIIRYQREGDFRDLDHMHQVLIERYNRVVSPSDKVYWHGDVCSDVELAAKLLPRFNGRKRLLLGNHDRLNPGIYLKYFERIEPAWRVFGYKELGCAILCTHVPVHPDSLLDHTYPNACINAHGHTHRNNVKVPGTQLDDPRYFNLSVEAIDYTPVHHDVLIERAKSLRRCLV